MWVKSWAKRWAWRWLPVVVLIAAWVGATGLARAGDLPIEREPINYLAAPLDDPIARLQLKLDKGERTLSFDPEHGYLSSVLKELGISTTSQMLVFSKTSFQHMRISPKAPRAVYFRDDAYVAWVRGGDFLEISAVDPKQGGVYYLLTQEEDSEPTFERQTHNCLACHLTSKTQDVPGHLVRSLYADPGGMPIFSGGSYVTDQKSPMEHRWGGWYVTGTHGKQLHMGNILYRDRANPRRTDLKAGANVTKLNDRFDTSAYLTGHSDIVALMVLEHQTQMNNLITRAGYEARLAGQSDDGKPSERVDEAIDGLLQYLLFSEETPLTAPVVGTSGYAKYFAALGPRDHQGRSLRDFDLKTRLFRYPCSYEIYSQAFDALPAAALDSLYHRLFEVLTGKDQSSAFAHLTPKDRKAILEILRQTKTNLPDEWAAKAP
ncbi:MAG: hypothetical protein ABI353_05215 [Isosphaeraceae bacterium]